MAGDDIRLTYVALTRAQSQVVAWWAPSWDEVNGGLSRLLRGRVLGAGRGARLAASRRSTTRRVLDQLPQVGGGGRPAASSAPSRPPTPPSRRRRRRRTGLGRARLRPADRRRLAAHLLLRADPGRRGGRRRHAPSRSCRPRDDELADELADEPDDGRAAEAVTAPDSLPSPMADAARRARRSARWCTACSRSTDPLAPDLEAELRGHVDEQRGLVAGRRPDRGAGGGAGAAAPHARSARWPAG